MAAWGHAEPRFLYFGVPHNRIQARLTTLFAIGGWFSLSLVT